MTGGTDGLPRYPRTRVAEAIAQAQNGQHLEPYSAIVLAAEVRALEKQLIELRWASEALVDHIERKYFHIVAPSDVARRFHGELGRLAGHVFNVLERVKP